MADNKHNIRQITFLGSFPSLEKCPSGKIPEYAFIGRSNVGKSSLINMICRRKDLARVSKQPGKTQTINIFEIDGDWRIADLPGYGYAKVSKTQRNKWKKMIERYLLKRQQLVAAFLLIDFRIEPQEADMQFANWMGDQDIPFAILFTKTDKVKSSAIQRHFNKFADRFGEGWTEMPPYFYTSALTGQGREKVLSYIFGLNRRFAKAAGN